ncbi:MAG: hypothetical protein ABW217_08235 [Polyangiaceae bacterium]
MAKSMSFQELALLLGALSCGGTVACARAAEPPHTSAAPVPMRAQDTALPALAPAVGTPAAVREPQPEPSERAETPAPSAAAPEPAANAALTGDARVDDPSTTTSAAANTVPGTSAAATAATPARPRKEAAPGKRKARKRGQGGCGAGTCA